MKKLILSSLSLVMYFLSAHSQDCTYYFPVKKGTTIEMKSYDAKNKETSSLKEVVSEKTANSVKFNCEVFDKDSKSISKGDYEVKCQNGEFIVDMSNYTRSIDMSKYKDMEIKIETDQMTIPSKPQAGQQLKDGEVRMKVNSGAMTILNMTVKIYNRKVEGYENITTPGGTFKCLKISYDIESKVIFNIHSKGVEWISENAGTIRTESYNEKGKLQGYSILTSLKE